jgi:beta-galactosidase GanA
MYAGRITHKGTSTRTTRRIPRAAIILAMAVLGAMAMLTPGSKAAVATAAKPALPSSPSSSPSAKPGTVTGPDVTRVTTPHTISWDQYSLMIDGKRVMMWSGEFHYYRLPSPAEWIDVLEKIKAAGFNAVSLYFDWEYHSPKQGVYDFSGVRDVGQLLNIANDLGIYVFVRPGPYINAELDDGGIANWIDYDAPLRSSGPCVTSGTNACPSYGDYESQALAWMHAVDQVIVKHQITNGTGSVIAYQLENEITGNDQYLADISAQVRADGITVPFFVNNANLGGAYVPIGAGGAGGDRVFWDNLYGYDNYPQGFNCSNPYSWSSPANNETNFRNFDTSTPVYIPEFQGGSFDNWGQATYFACNTLTNSQFERVFYLTNVANGTTMESNYMTFGGTSWGWEPVPSTVYSSYDYGSAISEGRVLTAKYYTLKELGFMFGTISSLWQTNPNTAAPASAANVSPPAATTCTNGPGGATVANCGAIKVYSRANPQAGTNFYFAVHSPASSTLDSTFQIGPVATADGTYAEIPQYNPAGGTADPAPGIELNGRDMKMLVADYNLDSAAEPQHLVYSTSNLMIDQTINGQDDTLLFAPKGQAGETDLRYASQPTVTTLSGTPPAVTWNQDAGSATGTSGDLVLDYTHSGLTEVRISGGGATHPLLLLLADESTAQQFWEQNIASSGAFLTPGGPILEQGPELVRTAVIHGADLDLTGDTNGPTPLTVWAPAGVRAVTWNGTEIPVRANSDGSLSSLTPLGSPPGMTLPDLDVRSAANSGWSYQYETPEAQPSFDDSQWTLANSDVTNAPTKPPAGQPVLYADQYGFHHGDVWYRAHFTASADLTSVQVAAEPGAQGVSEVWLNGTFLGSTSGAGGSTPVSYSVPPGVTKVGGSNVLAILTLDMGEGESGAENQPRGLISVTTTPADDGLDAYQPQTTLAGGAAPAGTTSLDLLSTTGFAAGQKITVGSGATSATATVTAVGAGAATPTPLSAPVSPGATSINVASVNGFAVGQQIAIGTGPTAETATVTSVGTAATGATQLYAPASAGDTTVHVANAAGFTVGQPIAIGTGANYSAGGFEQATVTSVGTQARDTDLAAPALAGDTTIKVASVTGLNPGDSVVIDYLTSNGCAGCGPADANNQETDTITAVGTAGATGTGLTLAEPLAHAHAMAASVIDYGSGISFTPALTMNHPVASAVQALGSGIAFTPALSNAHQWGASVFPDVIAQPTATTLAAPTAAGATTAYVGSVANYAVGGTLNIDTGTSAESATITTVGTAAAAPTTLFTPTTGALTASAGATSIPVTSTTGFTVGQPVAIDTGSSFEQATVTAVGTQGRNTTLAAAATAGATNVTVGSVTGLTAGDTLIIDTGSAQESDTITSVGTAGATGTGLTLATPLANGHTAGVAVSDPGTGISFSPALSLAHSSGVAVRALGSGISFTPALTQAHAAGAAVGSQNTTGISISPALTQAQPAGAAVTGPTPPARWLVQGNEGGEDITDTVRGADNNGGSYGENAGWSLPGYPDTTGTWTPVTLPASDPKPGIAWYRDTFELDVPDGVDASLALNISDVPTKVYHATIFLNGWNLGQYINNVGPQESYVLPTGILNPNGSNTIAIEVITTNPGGGAAGGGLGQVQLTGPPNVATYDDTDPALQYSGSDWTHLNSSNAGTGADYDTTESQASAAGDSVTVSFHGTAVRWVGSLLPDGGITNVYLDGHLAATVDGYAATRRSQHTMWSAYGLTDGTHTVRLVNTGTANPASSGTVLDVDAIDLPPSGVVLGGAGPLPGGPTSVLVNSPGYRPPTLTRTSLLSGTGQAVNGSLATVSVPPDALGTAFAATIDWGDGTSSAGTVTGSGASYTVTGRHIYAHPGRHVITVTLSDQVDGSVLATTG